MRSRCVFGAPSARPWLVGGSHLCCRLGHDLGRQLIPVLLLECGPGIKVRCGRIPPSVRAPMCRAFGSEPFVWRSLLLLKQPFDVLRGMAEENKQMPLALLSFVAVMEWVVARVVKDTDRIGCTLQPHFCNHWRS